MRALLCFGLAAGLPACIWVSDADVDGRYAELADADSDGYQDVAYGGDDCDDGDPAIHPGAAELCNGVDDDCSGSADDELKAPWYPDDDGDGYGDAGGMSLTCAPTSGMVDNGDDCDDGDAGVFPGADEYCNGVDDDCDDEVDEDDAEDAATFYEDGDGDGYGDVASFAIACDAPTGFVDNAEDCDDADAAVFPGADEYCNGVDDDCDDATDEDDALDAAIWYADDDDDGYGDPDSTTTACSVPSGYTDDASDCDDANDGIYPGGLEILDDDDDGDCDGGDDSFTFALHDTRSSSDVQGPRLARGDGQVYLGWAAEDLDSGGTVYDAVAVSIFDDEDPLGPERDFWFEGEPSNTAILGDVDLVANDQLWVVGSSWIDISSRDIRLDGVNSGSGLQGSYTSSSSWTVEFDQLQLGLSAGENVTAIGCGLGGAGLQAVQYHAPNLVAGVSAPSADTATRELYDDHDTCEYDHLSYDFLMGASDRGQFDYYEFQGGVLTSTQTLSFTVVASDIEITTDHGWRAYALTDLELGNELYTSLVPVSGGEVIEDWDVTSEPIVDVDVAIAPSGVVYVCAVQEDGGVQLLWNELLIGPSLRSANLSVPVLGLVEQCAITITADSVAWIALRSGDDIATAVVEVP
jgi:hypothetical protein